MVVVLNQVNRSMGQNRESRNKPRQSMTKEQGIYDGVRTIPSINGVEKTGQLLEK